MSVLSDVSLHAQIEAGRIVVEPLGDDAVQPASIDVRLGDTMRLWQGHHHGEGTVDLLRDQTKAFEPVRLITDGEAARSDGPHFWLWPNNLYLGVTLEWIEVPDDLLCHLHGRSSLGRLGIVIHQTAGLVDPGWKGHLTLEITVVAPTILRPGQPIGQLTFQRLTTRAERPYAGRYQGDREPTASRLHLREAIR